MKRFALVALLAAMLFGVATSASATELKVRGSFDVYGMWSVNLNDHDSDYSDGDSYLTVQRMRTYFDYVANENLKAVLGLEMDTVWGQGDTGDWGTDGNTDDPIELKHAYLDFIFPDTQIEVQAGLQYIALPSVFGNPVFDDDAAAITVSAPINEMFGVTIGYTRGSDASSNFDDGLLANATERDDADMAFIVAPITLDGFSISPYFGYAWLGQNSGLAYSNGTLASRDDSTVWVLGANAALTMFDPLTFAADLIYGVGDSDNYETKGWYAALAATYKMDMLTATLFTTYATGYEDEVDEDNLLPVLREGWGLTPYVGGGRTGASADDSWATEALGVGSDGTGLWVIGLILDDISFVEKLSHTLILAYAQGTSDDDALRFNGNRVAFTEEDDLFEISLANKYMIYENLLAYNELGYFKATSEVYENNLNPNREDLDASYFATVGFTYKF